MLKNVFAGLMAAALIAAPLPMLASGAAAQTAKTDTQTKPKKAKRTPTPAQQAMHARLKKCGAEWRAAKAAGKIEKGMKWPQYWSACNKRLKAGG
jgi:hypothetical protein